MSEHIHNKKPIEIHFQIDGPTDHGQLMLITIFGCINMEAPGCASPFGGKGTMPLFDIVATVPASEFNADSARSEINKLAEFITTGFAAEMNRAVSAAIEEVPTAIIKAKGG